MQDSHWKLTQKTLKPPTAYQRFKLRNRSLQVVNDFLHPRTSLHTGPTKPSSTWASRQGSYPCLLDCHFSRIAREPPANAVAIPQTQSEGQSKVNCFQFTINRSPIHSYSLADTSTVYDLRCQAVQQAQCSAALAQPCSTPALLVSMRTRLDSSLSSLKEEKAKVVAFEPWAVSPAATQAFVALKRGDSEAVKAFVAADRTLVRAVDAVSAI